MNIADWILRFTPLVILLALTITFVRRTFYREFPFFFVYIVFALLATPLRVSVRRHALSYFWVYWATEAVFAALALLAMNEVFRSMFEFDYEEHWWFHCVLPGTALLIACFFLTQPVRPAMTGWVTNAIFSFDLGVHFLQGIILLLFLLFDKILAAAYDQYEHGIIVGFGISAVVTAIVDMARSSHGSSYEAFFRYGPPVGYIAATLIWLHAFLRKPPSRQKLPITIHELLELLGKQAEVAAKIARNWRLRRYNRR